MLYQSRNLLARGLHYLLALTCPSDTGKDFPEDEPPPRVRLTIFQRCACLKFEDKEIQLSVETKETQLQVACGVAISYT